MIARERLRDTITSLLTLFLSSGTLLCCALPILLIALGLSGAVVFLTNSLPWLVALSRHKVWIFVISGIYLLFIAWLLYRPGRACPTDPELARLCERADRLNRGIFWAGAAIYVIGFVVSYLLLPIQQLF
jgi:hypothetical protein